MIGLTGLWHPRARTHWEHGHGRRTHGGLPQRFCAASVECCMLLEVSNLLSGTTYCCAGIPIG
jgi:hypothetical protein